MAHRIVLRFANLLASLITAITLIACGGGSSSTTTPIGGGAKPIDPSGNWTMTATDSGAKTVQFAALFSQSGSIVTANSFTAAGNPAPFSCVPFTATLANGQVVDVDNFTGDVVFGNNFGTFSFNTTLKPDGKSSTGTFTNMPPCTGLLASGSYDAAEVPTTTGSWTGTLQPCDIDFATGICAPNANPAGAMTATLSQDDATGNVTGQFTITGVAGLSAGTVAVLASDQDLLSGTVWQFTMSDASGLAIIVNGTLDMKNGFSGVALIHAAGSPRFILTMTH
jgi:hypothetical protein